MISSYRFSGVERGAWQVVSQTAIRGDDLPAAPAVAISHGAQQAAIAAWSLVGVASHARYATAVEVSDLRARQASIGRPAARCAALIPIRKSAAWWAMAQDERRAVFEETSRHTAIGMDYLPAIARRLHHCRDLGEPFDFLTWFDYAPEDAAPFDELVKRLRDTAEWGYVEREVDIRLVRNA